MNKYHRGKGEVVVPEANRLRFDACDFTQESATAEFNNHLASLTPLPDVKCPDTAPVGWLEGYVERYQVHAIDSNNQWVDCSEYHYSCMQGMYRRIFLVKPPPEPAPVEEVEEKETGVGLIATERKRQIEVEGWDNLHDDDHDTMQLSGAAGCYVANAINKAYEGEPHTKKKRARFQYNYDPELNFLVNSGDRGDRQLDKGGWKDGWPWEESWDKREKHDMLRSLVIAGALIAAEIDRLLTPSTNQ